jgi:uncharacterized membrane protein
VAALVDTKALLEVVVAAFVAGIGVIVVFSIAVAGAVRFVDMRRDGRPLEAAFFGLVTTLALLASAAAVIGGIVVMTQK